jgi:alkylresorcinol/alkylpyrone synthase
VPALIRNHLRQAVDLFLARYELTRRHIRHWIAHTGGPKVLEAMEIALELPSHGLERSWRSLAELGNLSSASVLYVLSDLLNSADAQQGDWGVLLAMGPGFCAEIVLFHW